MTHRHAAQKQANTRILMDNGIEFTAANHGEALLIRAGTFMADFFPSTCKLVIQTDRGPDVRAWGELTSRHINWLRQKIAAGNKAAAEKAACAQQDKQAAPTSQPQQFKGKTGRVYRFRQVKGKPPGGSK